MSIVHCDTHGNIDTDFNAEHFKPGTEECAMANTQKTVDDIEDYYI